MRKPKVNTNWPVKMLDFTNGQTSNEKFSRGKLAVFYKGETADHRYFSDSFAEKLVKSLPYTPVVSYYDEEKKDFKGHSSQQAIYGIVDPCVEPRFEVTEDGKEWCICDVVLYTERADETGAIAKQIVGHKQSLELADAKYVVNYDEKRHFKNIEFTDGKFVGISVLGKDQEPAFTGSQFFAANDEFEQKMKILRDYCLNEKQRQNLGQKEQETGDKVMKINSYIDFMKLSWGEISAKVGETIAKEYGNEAYTVIEDMDNEFAYVQFFSYIDGSNSTYRIAYSVADNGLVTLGAVSKVHRTWEVIDETGQEQKPVVESEPAVIDSMADTEAAESESNSEVEVKAEAKPEVEVEAMKSQSTAETSMEVATADADLANEASDITDTASTNDTNVDEETTVASNNAAVTPTLEKEANFKEGDEVSEQQLNEDENVKESSSASSFTESEREQFEALKHQEKVSLLESYKDKISEDDFNAFSSKVDSYDSKEALEVEILRAALAHKKEEKVARRAFIYACGNSNDNNAKNDNSES